MFIWKELIKVQIKKNISLFIQNKREDHRRWCWSSSSKASKPQLPPKPVIVHQPAADIKGMEQLIVLLKYV